MVIRVLRVVFTITEPDTRFASQHPEGDITAYMAAPTDQHENRPIQQSQDLGIFVDQWYLVFGRAVKTSNLGIRSSRMYLSTGIKRPCNLLPHVY